MAGGKEAGTGRDDSNTSAGLDETKTKEAVRRAQEWQDAEGGGSKKDKEKKRKMEEGGEAVWGDKAMSSEDMETFRAKRLREGDPMASLVKQEH